MPSPTRFIAGTVSANGAVLNGQEFIPLRTGIGRYQIEFTPPFTSISGVVATQVSVVVTPDTRDNAVVVNFDPSVCNIVTGRSDGSLENRSFSFIAAGD